MKKRINVKMKDAYNALVHPVRKDLEIYLDEVLDAMPLRSGLFLTDDDEKLPVYGPVGGCERVFTRKDNRTGARIVLTKDNYGSRATGLGGAGGTKCEAIDIVAGQLSAAYNIKDSDTESRGNFALDGARIYLTERGNINHYFGTENTDPLTSISDYLKSGIGIKADHTLIIGRERVRILAGLGKFVGGERTVSGEKDVTPIIEIGAITEYKYQKAVRGEALVDYLYEVTDYINALAEKVDQLEQDLSLYKIALAGHVHNVVGVGPTMPSISAVSNGASGIRDFFSKKLSGLIEEFHKAKTNRQFLGTKDRVLKPVPEDSVLSNTVYIGR